MNKSKIYMIVGICILCVSLIGTTLAYYTKTLFSTEVSTITHGLDYYINYEKGQTVSTNTLNPSDNYTGGAYSSVELWKTDDTYDIYGHIYLDITSMSEDLSNSEAVKYTIVNNNTVIAEGTVKNNSENTILMKSDIPLETTKQLYTVYIWLDKNGNLDTSLESASLSLTVRCEATMTQKTTLINHITSLYTNGSPTKGTNTNISTYYQSYQDSRKTWGLMNDGYDGVTKVTDTSALISGTKGNIRYYGANPNNYILFNCDDYSNQSASTCEIWRIMGIVDGKVKIIKNDSIGNLAWDQDKNQNSNLTTSYNDNWSTSSLQEFLNGKYYDRGTTTNFTYYSGSSGATQTTLNLENIGITTATREANLISESTWYLGGYSSPSYGLYADEIYVHERTETVGTTIRNGNPFKLENTNIGIMYASDYGYGADLNKCNRDIYYYEVAGCSNTDYLYNNKEQWLITPSSNNNYGAWYVVSNGYVNNDNVFSTNNRVHPVLYLDSELVIESGYDGSLGNEYRIKIS